MRKPIAKELQNALFVIKEHFDNDLGIKLIVTNDGIGVFTRHFYGESDILYIESHRYFNYDYDDNDNETITEWVSD